MTEHAVQAKEGAMLLLQNVSVSLMKYIVGTDNANEEIFFIRNLQTDANAVRQHGCTGRSTFPEELTDYIRYNSAFHLSISFIVTVVN